MKSATKTITLMFAAVIMGTTVHAADAAFEADSARLAKLLAEPQNGDKLLWMRNDPFVAEHGKLEEYRSLAKSLLGRIGAETDGADAQRKETLRRRSIVWRVVAASPDAPARLSPTPFSGELQESALSLDRPGEYGEFVDDPTASDGRAIKLFNTHYEWCVMVMMNRIAFEPGVKYRVRACLRCETEGKGQAFSAGVFDEKAWKNAGSMSANTDSVSSSYTWYNICTFTPNDAEYFWLAPGSFKKNGGKSAIKALWLDKIAFEPVQEEALAIIPAPQKLVRSQGECRFKGEPKFEKVTSIPPEGYEISVTKDGVVVRSSDDAGAFYAKMTLAQIERPAGKGEKVYPCLEIADAPKFKWRGVLIDTARHFLGKTTILRIIDEMSWYKFNVLQIHFTDEEGWTVEIPEFPELTKQGVKRGRSGLEFSEKAPPLFYSEKDIKEIVAYAAARHVKVVPEIEMPFHFGAALRAYPSMRCKTPGGGKVFCIGNPETVRFAEKVFDRVCELFPSDVIHFGGDECTRKYWKECPLCQEHIKCEGLKGVEELQPWLTRHLVEYLAKKGRRTIGWDEIFLSSSWEKWDDFMKAGGDSFNSLLPKTTMGMCWRPWGAGALAANKGYEIVRCPTSYCYFDYRQGLAEDPFPYLGGHVPLEKVYRFDVLEGVDLEARKNVVGGQCCNWGECTLGRYDLEWKLWPRALALSEVLWTYPDPAKRDFEEFSKRAAAHRLRLIRSRVNCAPLK